MDTLITMLVIGSSIWVLFDAKNIGVKKGQIEGIANMGPVAWFIVCLLLWIVGFPFYLAKRPAFKRINEKNTDAPQAPSEEKHEAGNIEAEKQQHKSPAQDLKGKVVSCGKTAKDSMTTDFSSGGWKSLIKNKYFMIIAGVIVLLLIVFGGNGNNSTPLGTDKEVQALVLDIAKSHLPDIFLSEMMPGLTYADIKDDKDFRDMVKSIDKIIDGISLVNIRVDSVQDEIKKSTSSADLLNEDGARIPIQYTAQRNSDGELFAEVYGLN